MLSNFIETINNCSIEKGAGSKECIATHLAKANSPIEKRLFEAAMSPYVTYGVKMITMPTSYSNQDAPVEQFLSLLDNLASRDLSGNAAKEAITNTLASYTERTALVLKKIILQNLNAGFSDETVNTVFTGKKFPNDNEGVVVPWYKCMLAEKMPKPTDKKQIDYSKQWIMEIKYDGQRNQAFVDIGSTKHALNHSSEWKNSQKILHRSRGGLQSIQYDGLFDEDLLKLNNELSAVYGFNAGVVFDGEVMGSDFRITMTARGSDNQEAKDDLSYILYDFIPMGDWIQQSCSLTQKERSGILTKAILALDLKKVVRAKNTIVNSKEEADVFYSECLDDGCEGAILKDPNALYNWTKREAWIKLKPVQTFDMQIVGFKRGNPDGKYANTLGSLLLRGVDESGQRVQCACNGSIKDKRAEGYKEPLREDFWINQNDFLGQIVEIEASPDTSIVGDREYQSLRWPAFKKMRPDKKGCYADHDFSQNVENIS